MTQEKKYSQTWKFNYWWDNQLQQVCAWQFSPAFSKISHDVTNDKPGLSDWTIISLPHAASARASVLVFSDYSTTNQLNLTGLWSVLVTPTFNLFTFDSGAEPFVLPWRIFVHVDCLMQVAETIVNCHQGLLLTVIRVCIPSVSAIRPSSNPLNGHQNHICYPSMTGATRQHRCQKLSIVRRLVFLQIDDTVHPHWFFLDSSSCLLCLSFIARPHSYFSFRPSYAVLVSY